jgi:uncharacterized membrane protein
MTMQSLPQPASRGDTPEEHLARGLGWLSVGLGVLGLVAPRVVAKLIGVSAEPRSLRWLGARELVNGVGILSQRRPVNWMWARVGGDVMDFVLLDAARRTEDAHAGRASVAAAAVLGVTIVDFYCSQQLTQSANVPEGGYRIEKSIVVNRPVEELYAFWHNFEHLPRVMPHVKSVTMLDERHSHWVAAGPGRTALEWNAETIDAKRNERIAWRSLEGSALHHAGSVRFQPAPAGRGTLVTLHLHYQPPAGAVGKAIATLFARNRGELIQADLRAFKQIVETGEMPSIRGNRPGRSRNPSMLLR